MIIERTTVDDVFHLSQQSAQMNRALTLLWCETWDVLKPTGTYISLNVTPVMEPLTKWSEGITKNIGQSPWASTEAFSFAPGEGAPEATKALNPSGVIAVKSEGAVGSQSSGQRTLLPEYGAAHDLD